MDQAAAAPAKQPRGDWMQTISGKAFYPTNPQVKDIDIHDIAHALAFQCRFGGHVKEFYSVAEHSVRVSLICAHEDAKWGLLHDATEAYVADVVRPVKRDPAMNGYREIESRLMYAICNAFGLEQFEMPASVHVADDVMLMTEARDLLAAPPKPWNEHAMPPLPKAIVPWTPIQARVAFMARYRQLWGTHK